MTSSLANISSSAFINRIGMGSKKIIHRMVFVRHGETIANQHMMNQSFDPEKKFLNTPLSTLGVCQAHDVSNYLIASKTISLSFLQISLANCNAFPFYFTASKIICLSFIKL